MLKHNDIDYTIVSPEEALEISGYIPCLQLIGDLYRIAKLMPSFHATEKDDIIEKIKWRTVCRMSLAYTYGVLIGTRTERMRRRKDEAWTISKQEL